MNEPKKIYLELGEDYDAKHDDFDACREVTWCQDKCFDTDVEYVRADMVSQLEARLAAAETRADHEQHNAEVAETLLEEERKRCEEAAALLRAVEAWFDKNDVDRDDVAQRWLAAHDAAKKGA